MSDTTSQPQEKTSSASATSDAKIEELRKEVRELQGKVTRFEAIAGALSIIAVFVTVMGFSTKAQLEQSVQTALREKTDRLTQVSFGLAYADSHPRLAIRPLLDSIQNLDSIGDPSMQEGVLITTMYVLDSLDDWESSRPVLEVIKGLPFHRYKLPLTFNNIGMTEMNVALLEKHSAKRTGLLDRARNSLERGMLRLKSQRELNEQEAAESEKFLTINYWRYYIAKKDWRAAEQMIERLKAIPDITVESFDGLRKWRQFRELDSESQKLVASMWARLREKWQPASSSTVAESATPRGE
jgi:hypothetical protein